MANLVISGDTSGTVTLTAPAVAGTTTLTLPTTSGTIVTGTTPSGTIVGTTDTQTLTNKTLTSPTISSLSSASATALTLQSAGTTAVTIDTSQNVGIGTTSPIQKLDVTNGRISLTEVYDLRWYGSGSALRGSVAADSGSNLYFGTGSSNTERMRIDSSGNLGIGTSGINNGKTSILFGGATANAIEAQDSGTNSGAGFLSCRNSSGTQIGSITRVSTTNAVAFNTTSDERLKSNIANTEPVLDKLMTVKVRQYDWTEGNVHQDYGFIAQELEPVLSGIVTKGKTDDDMWQLDYSRLTPHLVKAIQEQQTIINDLKARIETLEAK